MSAADCTVVERAGFVHDVGRAAVPSTIWEKAGALSDDERERVRLHTYYSDRVLSRCNGIGEVPRIASLHHERLDGSGYHRSLDRASIPQAARILAAADVFHALGEARPHRPALEREAAIAELRREAREERLDGDAVDAVLEAAGAASPGRARRTNVAGLTAREIEVLRLLARGATKREVAAKLVIAPKTADAHVQNIYRKIDVSSRAAAAMFAMRHDLLEGDPAELGA
jgi:HD-GYP domain-containing protein (c-di-GMP phosphodiesterase class II)